MFGSSTVDIFSSDATGVGWWGKDFDLGCDERLNKGKHDDFFFSCFGKFVDSPAAANVSSTFHPPDTGTGRGSTSTTIAKNCGETTIRSSEEINSFQTNLWVLHSLLTTTLHLVSPLPFVA